LIPDVLSSTTAAPIRAAEAVPAIGSKDLPDPPKPFKFENFESLIRTRQQLRSLEMTEKKT
jgi:hypothetical protein